MTRLDDKTWKEAAADAETTPWWVERLISEGKRARDSEAILLRVLRALADRFAILAAHGHAPAIDDLQLIHAVEAIEKAKGT